MDHEEEDGCLPCLVVEKESHEQGIINVAIILGGESVGPDVSDGNIMGWGKGNQIWQ